MMGNYLAKHSRNQIYKCLTRQRLRGYNTNYAKERVEDDLLLYNVNTILCESMYPLLQTIEVALRNSLNISISVYTNNSEWLLDGELLQSREKELIEHELSKRLCKYQDVSVDRIVSSLPFGFWTSLLDRRYEQKLWPRLIKEVFPSMPKEIRTMRNLLHRFDRIRKLRNRIFHYEPIWHWSDLKQQHSDIIEAIQWIEPEMLHLVDVARFEYMYDYYLLSANGVLTCPTS